MATENIRPELQDRRVSIGSLETYPGNARRGDLGVIMESLQTHGQYREIIVQKSTGRIIAGNHTWEAARQLGWENIAADLIDVDDTQARKIVLVDNASNDQADYDTDQLIDLIQQSQQDTDLIGTGFTDEGLQALIGSVDNQEPEVDPEDEMLPPDELAPKPCPKCGYDTANDPADYRAA